MSELIQKLATVNKRLGAFAADKTNKEQRYDYISADAVLSRVGDAMAAEGVMIVPAISESVVETIANATARGGNRYDAMVAFEMTITDGQDNIVQSWVGRGSDYTVPDKALYKAITSGHKYFLMKLFNIGVGNEDGEHETAPAQVRPAQPEPEPASYDNLTPDEITVISETAPAGFASAVAALLDHYKHEAHVKNALKQLGYTGIPTIAAKRLEAYSALKARIDEPLFEEES